MFPKNPMQILGMAVVALGVLIVASHVANWSPAVGRIVLAKTR